MRIIGKIMLTLAPVAMLAGTPAHAAGLLDKMSSSRVDRLSQDQLDAVELIKNAQDLRNTALREMQMAREKGRLMLLMADPDEREAVRAAAILSLDQAISRAARLEDQARALEHQAEAMVGQELVKLCRDEKKGRTEIVGYCERMEALQNRASSVSTY